VTKMVRGLSLGKGGRYVLWEKCGPPPFAGGLRGGGKVGLVKESRFRKGHKKADRPSSGVAMGLEFVHQWGS